MSGVSLKVVASRSYARGEIYISRGSREVNKLCFDFLYDRKDQIEKEFGEPLIWERLDEKIDCRIKSQLDDVSIYEREDWDKMIDYMVDVAARMEKAFRNPVKQLNRNIKQENKN